MFRRPAIVLSLAAIAGLLAATPLGAQAPAPAASAPAASAPAALAQAAPRARASWLSDRREFAVGDIITVLLDESTRASAVKGQVGTDQQSRDLGLGIDPPNMGTDPMPSIDATVGTDKRTSSRQHGESRRDIRFLSEMSVRVVAVSATGLLQVKGTKNVAQDKVTQDFQYTGWIRPQDVSTRNVVESARVADAKLVYQVKGNLGKTRGGLIGKVIGAVWP
ncbi:MAG TPA: flagellar basal body L-ring protein FlgH [Gemmatimonadaceae bacterium]|nr:flagellar basal body L-ring protein FlgH [Gemmatimonadaceae bacterium]